MKIVHICLASFFPDNYSYQENILPKYHKKLGYDVEVIASLETFAKDGSPTHLKKGGSYINENGIKVTRLDYLYNNRICKKLKVYKRTRESIEKTKPDILFVHGCQFVDLICVTRYVKKNQNVIMFIDNHADFSNSAKSKLSKIFLHGVLWRIIANYAEPYCKKFWGVLPARVNFLKTIYKLPESKCDLLLMGADDEIVSKSKSDESISKIRNKHNIKKDEFLIVTGGKIDQAKLQTFLLMDAVKQIANPKVKLIVFGSVAKTLESTMKQNCVKGIVEYIGWISSEEAYQYFAAADLVVFPGRHSVFWEQVAGLGIPMLCKYWEGTNHVDFNGSVQFLKQDSADEIKRIIINLLDRNNNEYQKMKACAEAGKSRFLYSHIALKSILK